MSESPVQVDQRNRQHTLDQAHIGQDSKRNLERMTLTTALIVSTLSALIVGIAIGAAARRRIDKWGHGYF
jgi:hypothetical protein